MQDVAKGGVFTSAHCSLVCRCEQFKYDWDQRVSSSVADTAGVLWPIKDLGSLPSILNRLVSAKERDSLTRLEEVKGRSNGKLCK